VKRAAQEVGVPVEWGGDWKSFKDGPHWQLPFKEYPK
jgi:peptidoglycan L-alanyl-D-glutamate endopeptidase CwlK